MVSSNRLFFSTDKEIQNLKPQEKWYSAKDKSNNGLFIGVKESGVKSWHYRYSFEGKQERLVIGRYPDLSLKDVRQIRNESASMVAKGISPKKNKTKPTSILFKDYGERYLHEVIKKDQGYDAAANQVKGLLKRMFDYAIYTCTNLI